MMTYFVLLLLCLSQAEASLKITRTSQDGRHPTAMEVEVQLPNSKKSVSIPLERSNPFDNLPVTVKQNGTERTFSARQLQHSSHAHYRDVMSKSVLSVREVKGHKRFEGHITHEGQVYTVQPHERSHLIRAAPIIARHQLHIRQKDEFVKEARQVVSRKRRQLNNSPTDYVVEVAVVLDSSVYSFFNNLYSSNALSEIHYYYTHIMNGVDVAYRNIKEFSISVRSVSLVISQSQADDSWLPPLSAPNRKDGGVALSAMRPYLASLSPKPDHVMAFTRMDLTGGGSSSVCGMAYLDGVCKATSVSINEDQGLQSWSTAAHELAHNLGSDHDGGSGGCNPATQNIMAPSSSFYTLSTIKSAYHFSSCSIAMMKKYVEGFAGGANCMKSNMGNQVWDLQKTGRIGVRLTLDQVCGLAYENSPAKFFLTDDERKNPALICARIYCKTASGSGASRGLLKAPIGSHCGNKMSCNNEGQCTNDDKAPAAQAGCFWGDSFSAAGCNQWVGVVKMEAYRPSYCGYVKTHCCKSVGNNCDGY